MVQVLYFSGPLSVISMVIRGMYIYVSFKNTLRAQVMPYLFCSANSN